MTDKEILIEAFKRIGVDFELDEDGDLEVFMQETNEVYFVFNENGKYMPNE